MPTSAVPSNDNRPASFDAELVRILPRLHAVAIRSYPHEDSSDVVNDGVAYALAHWTKYTGDVSMFLFLRQCMRFTRARSRTAAAAKKRAGVTFTLDFDVPAPANNDNALALSQAVRCLDERSARVVLMQAAGGTLDEIGTTLGVTRERIRQISGRAVSRMQRAADVANSNWAHACARRALAA